MKVGIETECLSQTIRGIGYYTLTLIEALKQQKLDLICYHTPKVKLHSVQSHFFKKRPSIPFINSIASLFHYRCFHKVDLVHFPEPKILYAVKPKVPFVLTVHDVMPLLFPHFFPKKSRLMMELFLPRYLRDAQAVVTVSHQTKADLLNLFSIPEKKVHVIGCALLPRPRKSEVKKDPFVFYIGSFEPRKNLRGIIEAYAQLKAQGFPHKLVIAGKEEGKNFLPWELIRKLHLEKDIVHKGYISEEEKRALFEKASLLIWPSFYEGFGLPLLEAMASGTPIVTSNCSAMKEIVGDAALCVNPFDVDAIGQAMMQVVSSQTLTLELMRKGLARSEAFSLEVLGKKLLSLYSSSSVSWSESQLM